MLKWPQLKEHCFSCEAILGQDLFLLLLLFVCVCFPPGIGAKNELEVSDKKKDRHKENITVERAKQHRK